MYMVFDVQSKILSYAFLGLITLFFLMIGYLIVSFRKVEKTEALKREEMLKKVISDFTSKDKISDLVIKEFPKLSAWWKNKQIHIESAEQLAVQSHSKALLAEIASRVGHNIGGAMSNIEILTGEMSGLSEKYAKALKLSINKLKNIASDILDKTKSEIENEKSLASKRQDADLNKIIQEIINQKSILLDDKAAILFQSDADEVVLKNVNTLDLERSISNIVNNAVEASGQSSDVVIAVKKSENSAEIQVKDSTCGISPDHLQKIGMKGFSQDKANGNGIGIYDAKQFIESLGGIFSVQSVVGQGTIVSMILFK